MKAFTYAYELGGLFTGKGKKELKYRI